jgi:hypothetical protein
MRVYIYIDMGTNIGTTMSINVADALGSKFCVSSEDGQKLHDLITKFLSTGKSVAISFTEVADISSAFLDAAIGQLYNGDFSEDELKQKLSLMDISAEDCFVLERLILRTKYYCGDPKRHNDAVCELIGEDYD